MSSSNYNGITFVDPAPLSARPLRHAFTSVDQFRQEARHRLSDFELEVRELNEVMKEEQQFGQVGNNKHKKANSTGFPAATLSPVYGNKPVVEISLTSDSSVESARDLMQSI